MLRQIQSESLWLAPVVDAEAAFGDAQISARREHEVFPRSVGCRRRRSVLLTVRRVFDVLSLLASSRSHPNEEIARCFICRLLSTQRVSQTLTIPRPSLRLMSPLHRTQTQVSRTNTSTNNILMKGHEKFRCRLRESCSSLSEMGTYRPHTP